MTRLRGWAPKGRAPRRQGSSWPLEDRDFPRRAAQRPHRSALPVRRADQRRALPRLCRTVPRAHPQAGRRRDPGQPRLPQGKGRATGDPGRRRAPCVSAEILARPQSDRAGLRQVQNPAAKGGSAKLRSSLPSLRSDSHPISPRRMRRIHQERRLCVNPKADRLERCPIRSIHDVGASHRASKTPVSRRAMTKHSTGTWGGSTFPALVRGLDLKGCWRPPRHSHFMHASIRGLDLAGETGSVEERACRSVPGEAGAELEHEVPNRG